MTKKCFVIIGYGEKTDPETRRQINLDRSFEHLIKPVCDQLGIDCFRAKDIKHSGIIDVPMYEWILNADLVIADISTLNPNALYELGVRHALKPYTTVVISENQLKYPFDVNHTIILGYEHLGKDIGVTESIRFKEELKETLESILSNVKTDSPVYTYINTLQPPFMVPLVTQQFQAPSNETAVAYLKELIEDAEKAKSENDISLALQLYNAANILDKNNPFLIQRKALLTYKKDETSSAALQDALNILQELRPEETTDTETLGLAGAINKRLFEVTSDINYLDKSLDYYERGFYVKQDYYNGINAAFLLSLKASLATNRIDAIGYQAHSNHIRTKVVRICLNLLEKNSFVDNERDWVIVTLAEAYLGIGNQSEYARLTLEIKNLSPFVVKTFKSQIEKLGRYLEIVKNFDTA